MLLYCPNYYSILLSSQAADGVPKLCYAIEEKLTPSDRERESSSLPCFMTLAEFEEWVAKDVGVIVTEDERKVSVEFLDSSGIVSADLLFRRSLIFIYRSLILVL